MPRKATKQRVCPKCGGRELHVTHTRPMEQGSKILRRLACACGWRWKTLETNCGGTPK